MVSYIQEVAHSLRKNKLRTALTAFSIAWGIMLLVVLLGSGRGIQEGIRRSANVFGAGRVESRIDLYTTDKPYGGYQSGRQLSMTPRQLASLRERFGDFFPVIVPSFSSGGEISSDYDKINGSVQSITIEEQSLNKLIITHGRLFTVKELSEGSKVIILSSKEVKTLFPGEIDPIGKAVMFRGVAFTVVGVKSETDIMDTRHLMPLSTYHSIMPNYTVLPTRISLSPREDLPLKEVNKLLKEMEVFVRRMLSVAPDDTWAVHLENPSETQETLETVFKGIDILLWIIGIASLSIGVIGVANIMQVTVQERMREIGIRKALGAKPRNIISLVLGESVLISVLSGTIGLLVAIGLLEFINDLFDKYNWGKQSFPTGPDGENISFYIFADPHVDLGIAVGALVVLVVAGIMAGYAPARKAIRIPAVVAMRDNK